jgi:aspartate racemase
LDKLDVNFIVMVCNTIYLFYDKLQKEIKTPILDLRKELKKLLLERGVKSALIIGTPNTIKEGLYKFDGIKTYEPDEEEMTLLTDIIFKFNNGVNKKNQKLRNICDKYINKGAEIIILGCTEFGVMLGDEEIPKINTIDVLVDVVINKLNFPD